MMGDALWMSKHKRRFDNVPITLYPIDEDDCSALVMSGQAGRLLVTKSLN